MDTCRPASGLASTAELIAEIKAGRMVVVLDAQDRENEGDLIIAAQYADAAAINFMARYGRGLICLALTQARADALGLRPMRRHNAFEDDSAFTDSIDATQAGVTTGISAPDRAQTIAVAIDAASGPEHISIPGHMFPLVSQANGVLDRAGHTEAGLDLARLAGLIPAAVICEIIKDDGTMARFPDLRIFAQTHGLKLGTIEDLVIYRNQAENDGST